MEWSKKGGGADLYVTGGARCDIGVVLFEGRRGGKKGGYVYVYVLQRK